MPIPVSFIEIKNTFSEKSFTFIVIDPYFVNFKEFATKFVII